MYRSPHMPASEKSKAMRVLNTVMKSLRILGCSRRDDIIERAYNMPDMPSSRPSIARTSMSRPSATGPSTTLFSQQDFAIEVLRYVKYYCCKCILSTCTMIIQLIHYGSTFLT